MLSGHVLSISETGCKDFGKGLPSALSPKEKILVESFETKKKKEGVFFFFQDSTLEDEWEDQFNNKAF